MIKAKTVKILILQGLGMIFFVFLNEPPETHAFRNVGNAGEQFMRREQKRVSRAGSFGGLVAILQSQNKEPFPLAKERERERENSTAEISSWNFYRK